MKEQPKRKNFAQKDIYHIESNTPIFEHTREIQNTKIEIMDNEENRCAPHFHTHVEIFFLHKGEQTVTINKVSKTLKPKQLAIADKLEVHSYDYQEGSISTVLIIPEMYLDDYSLRKQLGTLGTNFVLNEDVYDLCMPFVRLLKDKPDTLLTKGYINVILGYILRYCKIDHNKKQIKSDTEFYRDICEYIYSHIKEDISLKQIAHEFNYCPDHFSKKFKTLFSCSFSQYLNESRLQKMFELKELYPKLKLAPLIFESGFQSIPAFYAFFQKHTGTSPSKFFKKSAPPPIV